MKPLLTRFLLADDDADDASLFCEALALIGPEMVCDTAENGRKVLDILSDDEKIVPDIIFLDINMPVLNGWECLEALKDHSAYRNIPTIMYSTSSAQRDVKKAYDLGVMLFITKPEDFRELSRILKILAMNSPEAALRQLDGFRSVKFA